MVGYKPTETLNQTEKLIAGCISGVTTRFITQPLDIIKLRTQIVRRGSSQIHWLQVFKSILKEEGIKAFWRGHNMGQLHSILAVSSQFYIYEVATKYAHHTSSYNNEYRPLATFACGLFAGTISTTLMMPLEVIRVRQMMVQDQYKGLFNGMRRVYRYGGLPAFYSGLGASLLQMGPAIGISFSVFNFVQERLLRVLKERHCGEKCQVAKGNTDLPLDLALASSLAGCIAGFISKSVTYPFDLAKRRLQIASHRPKQRFTTPALSDGIIKCDKLFDCLRLTVQKEGITGLFRGWKVTIYKAQMTNIVAFTTYELVCYALRNYDA